MSSTGESRPVDDETIRKAISRGLDGGTRPRTAAELNLLTRQLEGHAGLLLFEVEEGVASSLEGPMREVADLVLVRTRQTLEAAPGDRRTAHPFYVEDLAGVVRSLLVLHCAALEPA